MISEIIYYCGNCAVKHSLPIKVDDKLKSGYCRLCGTHGIYVGNITTEEAKRRELKVPDSKEFGEKVF